MSHHIGRRQALQYLSGAAGAAFAAPRVAFSAAEPPSVRIGLAALRGAPTIPEGIEKIRATIAECRNKGVAIVCFPETYLPGLRGGPELPPPDQPAMERALEAVRTSCGNERVNAIVGMEWVTPRGLENRAFVISAEGRVLGYQTKNQLSADAEEKFYVPGNQRALFVLAGVRIGIVICHEGWRYPETVRWAAVRDARIVFQPQVTGRDPQGPAVSAPWGEGFYEMAMQCRAQENTVYFASVNQAMNRQNSATTIIDPKGKMAAYVPRGQESLLVADLDLTQATGFYAHRLREAAC
jgi:N-carbamoylputrescine amidase